MTYSISAFVAKEESPFDVHEPCFCCGQKIEGPVVSYDAHITPGTITRVLMHRDCAFAMAQRIICDAWPNRRHGDSLMANDH